MPFHVPIVSVHQIASDKRKILLYVISTLMSSTSGSMMILLITSRNICQCLEIFLVNTSSGEKGGGWGDGTDV